MLPVLIQIFFPHNKLLRNTFYNEVIFLKAFSVDSESAFAILGFQPANVIIGDPKGGHLSGEVAVCEYLGSEQFAYIDCGFDEMVTVRVASDTDLQPGSDVSLVLDEGRLYRFGADGVRR